MLALHNVPTDAWLTNASLAVDSCDVSAPFEYETEEITLVTALLDLGRGSADSGTFKRVRVVPLRALVLLVYWPHVEGTRPCV